jgi:cholesterol transport system auxiliary component
LTLSPRIPAQSFLALSLALVLAGCGTTPKSYDLSAASPGRTAGRGTLIVEPARAEPPFDGDLIVIRTADGLERLGGAQWTDSLPRLTQSRVVETLQNAGLAAQLRAVGQTAAYRLQIDIRRFEIDSVRREARVELAAQIFSGGGGVSRLFVASEPVDAISGAAPVQALDRASSRALADLARWTASGR